MNRDYARLFLFLLCPAFMLFCGCAADEIREDLGNYVTATLPPLQESFHAALQDYDAVSGDNFTDEAVLYETVKSRVLPLLKESVLQAEAARVTTDNVARLHDAFLAALRRYVSGFQLYLLALDQQNMQNTAVALEELEEAQSLRRDFEIKFEEACEAAGITPDGDPVGE